MDQYASDDHLIKMRSLLLIRCLPKISLSSLTFTGSQIADCHLEVIFDVNMHRNLSWNLFTVDGKNVHRQFLSEPGSVRYFSTLPLTTVWSSNYQTLFFDFFEVCITKMVTLSPNVQTFLLISLTLYFQITWSVILHSDWSIASQLTLLWP